MLSFVRETFSSLSSFLLVWKKITSIQKTHNTFPERQTVHFGENTINFKQTENLSRTKDTSFFSNLTKHSEKRKRFPNERQHILKKLWSSLRNKVEKGKPFPNERHLIFFQTNKKLGRDENVSRTKDNTF